MPLRSALPPLLLALAAASCAVEIPEPRPGYAICGPCAEAGDLGCVEVKMGPKAPRAEVGGRTYWFCSPVCRDQFLADAARPEGARAGN